MKKIISVFIVLNVLSLAFNPVFALKNQVSDNIALGKPITASQVAGNTYKPENANDGDINTAWAPTGGGAYIQIDLGKPYVVSHAEFVSRQDVDQPDTRRNFQFRASNTPDFSEYEVLGGLGNEGFEHRGTWGCDYYGNSAYRYIRLTKTNAEYFFVNEIRLYGIESGQTTGNFKSPKKYEDLTDGDLYEETNLLYMLGIMEGDSDGLFHPERKLRRAEASKLVLAMLNLSSSAKTGTSFYDVPLEYWGNPYIAALYEMGIVDGKSDGLFYPESFVTGNELIKMIICALGYDTVAQSKGGYPGGYISLASNLKILPMEFLGTREITRREAAQIICSALMAAYPEPSVVTDKIIYKTDKDLTVIEKLFNVRKYEGKVTGNSTTTLTKGRFLDDNKIEIDGIAYKTGDMSLNDLLGQRVVFYVAEHDTQNEYVLFGVSHTDNRILTLEAKDIISSESVKEIKYYDNNERIKKASVARGADVIYNGRAYNGFTASDFSPQNGSIQLIDDNLDKEYDTVIIKEYEDFIIDNVSKTDVNVSVFDKFGKSFSIKSTSDEACVFYNSRGQKISCVGIEEWDCAEVYLSKDGEYAYVLLTGDKIDGTIEGFEGDDKITIAGKEYEISPTLKGIISDGQYPEQIPQIGIKTLACINAHGYIVAFKTPSAIESGEGILRYGYLMGVSSTGGLSGKTQMMLCTTDNEVIIADVTKRVLYDGSYTDATEISRKLNTSGNNGTTIGQLIKYRINGKMEVKEICTTAYDISTDSERIQRAYLNTSNGFFDSNKDTYDFYVSPQTAVFTVPLISSGYEEEIIEASHYSSGDISKLRHWDYYTLESYDEDEFDRAGAIVTYVSVSSGSEGAKNNTYGDVILVDRISSAIADGEEVSLIYGYSGSNLSRWQTVKGLDLTKVVYEDLNGTRSERSVSRGDIIRVNTNRGFVDSVLLILDSDLPEDMLSPANLDTTRITPPVCRVILGAAVSVSGNQLGITNTFPTEGADIGLMTRENYDMSSAAVYLYNSKDNIIQKVTPSEVANHIYKDINSAKIFARTKSGVLSTILILN